MQIIKGLDSVVDWFMPPAQTDALGKTRIRMFLISHLFGPVLGTPIPLILAIYDPAPWPQVHVLAASIWAFWLFPIALKLLPQRYTQLAFLSVFNLSWCILWGSYQYGGASSPFLMWFLVVPLLAFFYLGSSHRTRIIIFTQIAVGLAAFYAAFQLENSFPSHIPVQNMVEVGVISAFCAASYVFVMASYYASVVDSQSELVKEVERHERTTAMLTVAKEEAERANGAKSDFLAKMSHELRTPLNAVLGYTEILLEDAELEGRGEQISDLQKISAGGKHLLAMVNDILDISKIEAGKMDLNVEKVDLDKLIWEVESTARPLAAKNTNLFVVERSRELGTVWADATKLRQAIFNLLSNSAKFTQNGRITLDAMRERRDDGEWITISVADTGIGISKEQQANLFANFSQASPSIAAKYGGTGLGLSLSQKICRLMGGTITVESEPGKGSRFTIHLPAKHTLALPDEDGDGFLQEANADLRARAKAFAGVSGHSTNHQKQERILLVDDDKEFLALAERLLLKEGYSPIVTDAPQSVLQVARTVRPYAILLDIRMPGLSGWDVLHALRSDPQTLEIPIIILSILDEQQKAREQGADAFLTKPLDINKLKIALTAARDERVLRKKGGGQKATAG
jgi:signal transduction histidine kinase/CheY-like chemotaxis protein